jgi:hypothetical protein
MVKIGVTVVYPPYRPIMATQKEQAIWGSRSIIIRGCVHVVIIERYMGYTLPIVTSVLPVWSSVAIT